MTVITVDYFKKFISQTTQVYRRHHRSGDRIDVQEINDKDKEIREELKEWFAFREGKKEGVYEGFDGNCLYSWEFSDDLNKEGKESCEYQTRVHLIKAGLNDHDKLTPRSEIEGMLVSRGFK
ncbi:MAG: hypothetical protein AABW47_00110 [Nanoarchaeota archaeon]